MLNILTPFFIKFVFRKLPGWALHLQNFTNACSEYVTTT